jgi:hypothetical protein
MPSVYNTVFGGNPVAPAIPTYLALSFSVDTVLGWPLESNITSPAVAEWIDCTATAASLTLQLSDARQVSTGYTAIFNNVGANTFSVLDAQGNTLMAPTSGTAWILVLSDNSTLQGTWHALQLGASTSSANAAALAGAGLKAITTTLNEQILISPQAVNYTIGSGTAQDRASCIEWTGGAGGTFSSSSAAVLGTGWFCYIKNSGTGVVSFTPGSGQINGAASMTFNPNDSAIIATDGTNFFSIGFGQSVASSFNFVTISLAGDSGNVILTGAQLNRISYKFTGALAGNTTVVVPASIQQYWVDNETTGAFTLTISAGGAGSTFVVPQATRVILYCDGLNIVSAITSGAVTFGNGTAASPSITFTSDGSTGLYLPGTHVLGFAAGGIAVGSVNGSGQWSIPAPVSGDALTLSGVAGAEGLTVHGSSTTGQSLGAQILAGTNTADRAFGVFNQAGSALYFSIRGDGALLAGFAGAGFTVTNNGNVIVGTPASGVPVTVNGPASGSNTAVLSESSDSAYQLTLGYNYGTANVINSSGSAARPLQVQIGGTTYATWGANGNLTLASASSGATLTVDGTSGTAVIAVVSTGAASSLNTEWTGGAWNLLTQSTDPLTLATLGAAALTLSTSGSSRVIISATGGVNISAPSSALDTLTSTGTAGQEAGTFHGSSTSGQSFGVVITAGTTSADAGLRVFNQAGTTQWFGVRGDGVVDGNDGTSLFELGYKDTPLNTISANYTIAGSDRGKCLNTSTNGITITVPSSALVAGTTIAIRVASGATITVAQGSGMTIDWAGNGAATGNRTLTGEALATLLFTTLTTATISGAGVS